MVQPEDVAAAAVFAASMPARTCLAEILITPTDNNFYRASAQAIAGMPRLMAGRTVTVPAATLQDYITRIFAAAGCAPEEAARTTGHLLSANLTGHDSHGIIRVPRYVQWLQEGKVFAGRSITVVAESATHAVVDGNQGLGQTVGEQAVDLGIAKAKSAGPRRGRAAQCGPCRPDRRLGASGPATPGWSRSISSMSAKARSWRRSGASQRRFGTNPICIGVPQPDGPPLLLDLATSIVAEGKVLVASNGGKPIPHDALVTADGRLSSDPAEFYGPLEGTSLRDPGGGTGSLRAFGEHKGSGIAFMCEILAGCLCREPDCRAHPRRQTGRSRQRDAVDLSRSRPFRRRPVRRHGPRLRRVRPRLPARSKRAARCSRPASPRPATARSGCATASRCRPIHGRRSRRPAATSRSARLPEKPSGQACWNPRRFAPLVEIVTRSGSDRASGRPQGVR